MASFCPEIRNGRCIHPEFPDGYKLEIGCVTKVNNAENARKGRNQPMEPVTQEINIKMLVEAFLFAADSPLSVERLAALLEAQRTQIKMIIEQLQEDYSSSERGFYLAAVAGGYQFRTRAELAPQLRRLNRERATKFSRAAMETLSIVAYRQPVTRAEVEYLRGVDSGGVMKNLLDKNLLRILGKKDIPGRPLMYGTSRHFLELLGLQSLNDLPTLKEFSALDPELTEAIPLAPDQV